MSEMFLDPMSFFFMPPSLSAVIDDMAISWFGYMMGTSFYDACEVPADEDDEVTDDDAVNLAYDDDDQHDSNIFPYYVTD